MAGGGGTVSTTQGAGGGPLPALPPGGRLGRYLLLEPVGSGGMGVVYAAYDPELDRKVAVKLVRQPRADARVRLHREAQAMARLTHPNVVAVFDVGTLGDEVYLAMEYVNGVTLRRYLERNRPGWREIVALFRGAGRGLAAAHAAGLVHRDFKPDNVLVAGDGRVLVTDFGLARALLAQPEPAEAESVSPSAPIDTPLTHTGAIVGTPAYMAPEQHRGDVTDARGDQFSFCVALHEALFGVRPFAGATSTEIMDAVMAGKVPPPGKHPVPAAVRRAILRGLSADPAARHASMASLLHELERDRWIKRHPALFGLTAAVVTAAISATVVWSRPAPEPLCPRPDALLAGAWDAERSHAVEQAFLRSGAPNAAVSWASVKRALDKQASAWLDKAVAVCEDTRVRGLVSEAGLDLRTACLDRRRRELATLGRLLTEADAKMVARAPVAVAGLERLEDCDDIVTLAAPIPPPREAAISERVAALQDAVTETRAMARVGRYKQALPRIREIAQQASDLGYPPLEARALTTLGQLEREMGQTDVALAVLERATLAAEHGRDDRARAHAQLAMAQVLAYDLRRLDEALRAVRAARAALERSGVDQAMLADIELVASDVYGYQGRYADAELMARTALARRERASGPRSIQLTSVLNNLGGTLRMWGRPDEAIAAYQRALAIYEEHAPDHPRMAIALENLGVAYDFKGDASQALHYLRRALERSKLSFGPTHPLVANQISLIADVMRKLGRPEEALAGYRESLAVWEQLPETVSLSSPLLGAGIVLSALGRPAEAVPLLERARTLRESASSLPEELGEVRFALARALRAAHPAERSRSRELARRAREGFASLPNRGRELAEIDAWLASHR